jgi:hypothetical protein
LKRIVLSLASVLLLSAASSAFAQVGIYGKLDLNPYTDTNAKTQNWIYGGGIGIYDDFVHAGPIAIGGDLRGDIDSGSNHGYRSLLLGPRLALKVPVVHLRPYVEPLFGYGGAKYTGQTAAEVTTSYDNKILYGGVGGLDLTILPHLDWRVIEGGYLKERNGSLPNPSILLSTGIVFRL